MNYRLYIIFIIILTVACKKEDPPVNEEKDHFSNGLLVLNEGLFQQNNASLSWIDLSSEAITTQVFFKQNERPLGDTGNDMAIYGGKLYIVVNASSTLEVLNARTLKSIKQIPLQYNGQGQQPRHLAFHQNKAYVSSYDGFVNIIDTSTLSIKNRIAVGENPEGIAIVGDQLYVANSGGLSYPDVDSTVYAIDLISETVKDTFVVGKNPGDVVSDKEDDIYVVKRGDYGDSDPSELVRISAAGTIMNLGIDASFITKKKDVMYISHYNYDSGEGTVTTFDLLNEAIISSDHINGAQVETLYGVHPSSSEVLYIYDAMNFTNTGYIRKFNDNGNLIQSYHVGLNPTKLIHYE